MRILLLLWLLFNSKTSIKLYVLIFFRCEPNYFCGRIDYLKTIKYLYLLYDPINILRYAMARLYVKLNNIYFL